MKSFILCTAAAVLTASLFISGTTLSSKTVKKNTDICVSVDVSEHSSGSWVFYLNASGELCQDVTIDGHFYVSGPGGGTQYFSVTLPAYTTSHTTYGGMAVPAASPEGMQITSVSPSSACGINICY